MRLRAENGRRRVERSLILITMIPMSESESTPVFADGFGRRVVRIESVDAVPTEHLLLSPAVATHPAFAAALGERIAKLNGRRLTAYARVQRLDGDGPGGVAIRRRVQSCSASQPSASTAGPKT
jgi:hypothetical protein